MKKRLKLLCYLCPALVLTICATVGATTWNRGKASDFVQAQMLKVSVDSKKHIDQKYKDGVYEATVVCGPKNGGAFKPYNLHVKVTIEGGKITDITEINGSGEQYISADSRFISWAVNGKGNEISVVEQIKALKDINNISNGNVDAVSRATYSSKAIVIAVLEAVEQAKVE